MKDPALLEQLRIKIANGENAVETMRFLIEKLRLGPDSRFVVVTYFAEAFNLWPRDVAKLGAWEFFNDGTCSDEEINAQMTPHLFQSYQQFVENS